MPLSHSYTYFLCSTFKCLIRQLDVCVFSG